MKPLRFAIEQWAAWAPGLETAADWRAWSQGEREIEEAPTAPDVRFLPSMLRRRTSSVTRAGLWVAHECGADTAGWPSVFASRHGELVRSHRLLTELAERAPLSPNAFSLSVHNTASGLHAIATGNRAASTSLAADRDTLPIAIIEALGQLRAGAERVLVVHADERAPSFYQPWVETRPQAFALGLVLALPDAATETVWQLTRAHDNAVATADMPEKLPELALLHMLAGDRDQLCLVGESASWQWQRV